MNFRDLCLPVVLAAVFSLTMNGWSVPAKTAPSVSAAVPTSRPITAVPQTELDHQFATLQFDLKRRANLAKLSAEVHHPAALIHPGDRDPADVVVRRARALIADLEKNLPPEQSSAMTARLAALEKDAKALVPTNAPARRALFDQACQLRREIAFSNPLLSFDQILFIKRHRSIFEHMCDQFYGITARPGGGLYVLQNPFGPSPTVRDVLANATVESGRLKGQRLVGGNGANAKLEFDGVYRLSGDQTTGGSFLSPAISYDGQQILFAYVECTGSREHEIHTDTSRGHWDAGRCYHIFKVNADGTHL